METRWTQELREDVQALAWVAALQQVDGVLYVLTPDDEAIQAAIDRAERETDEWVDEETVAVLYGRWPGEAQPPSILPAVWCLASWPVLKARVVGFVRTWPSNAPLLG
jgi:hypothetical protein